MIVAMLKRPVAVSMFFVAVAILGAVSFTSISIEGKPDVDLPQILVSTRWPGATPEVIQVFLTSPIEEVAAQVEGLEEMFSSSTRQKSIVTLKFQRDTDMDFAKLDLNERLARLRENLPPGASQPVLRMDDSDDVDFGNFMTFDVSGPYDMQYLTKLVQDYLRDHISSVEGVSLVNITGEREKSLRIELDREAMDLYGLVPAVVSSKVRQLGSETYETARTFYSNKEYTVIVENSVPSIQAVQELVLRVFGDQVVRVRDVGTVTLGYAKERGLSRLNGNPTLNVRIGKEVGANVIATSKRVRETVAEQMKRMPEGVRVDWIADQGEDMQEELDSVYMRGLWCVVLIVVLLLFFLQSASAALVITLNIFFSVLITLNFMYYFDITVNILTLSGLAVGFGMLVDNAIVVLENIFRHRELGASRFDAAVEGCKEVIWAIVAATLTTVASFACMYMLEGRMNATFLSMAIAVIFSLSASLLVSFTFTPMLSMLIRGSSIEKKKSGDSWVARNISRPLDRFADGYKAAVMWTLNHKMLVVFCVATLFFLFYRIAEEEIDRGSFFLGFNRDDELFVGIRMPEGAELETANDVIRQFEEPLLKAEGYEDVSTRVSGSQAIIRISFDSEMLNTAYPLALKSRLIAIAQKFAGLGIYVGGISSDDNYFSGSTGFETYNSQIRLMGYNYADLMDYADDLLRKVKRNRRVRETKVETSARSFRSRDETETALRIERDKLRTFNVELNYLLSFIRTNLTVESTSRTRFRGEEIVLEVKYDNSDDFDIKALESLVIRTEDNRQIRLSDLFTIEERKVPGGIDRKDQQYAITVKWDYKGSARKARKYNEEIYEGLQLPPGFRAELDYNDATTDEEEANLQFVIMLAIIVVFMIIASLYESFIDPLVIFLTIPLSFIGVAWIYWYTNESFSATSYIGLIILAGIVVNNSILLVSHLNDEVRASEHDGRHLYEAIADASRDRLRPILLTAITTIVGLLPLMDDFVSWMLYSSTIGEVLHALHLPLPEQGTDNMELQSTLGMFDSLSRSTVGGMLTATFSTLLVIPVVYALFFRAKQWLNSRINEVLAQLQG